MGPFLQDQRSRDAGLLPHDGHLNKSGHNDIAQELSCRPADAPSRQERSPQWLRLLSESGNRLYQGW